MWPDKVNFNEDYAFKSSPESCSDNSFCTDIMDVTSEEDFLTQLSSELDIPLLLSQGEDEMAVLNSFFDKSPDEILSDIKSPDHDDSISNDSVNIKDLDFLNWGLDLANIEQPDYKSEEHSDASSSSSNSLEPSTPPAITTNRKINPSIFFNTNIAPKKEVTPFIDSTTVQVVPQNNRPAKVPIKRVHIKPKAPYAVPVNNSNNIVVIKNEFPNVMSSGSNIVTTNKLPSKMVMLDRISTLPVNTFKSVTPRITTASIAPISQTVTVPSIVVSNGCNLDPKIFKRQQRKIKNRESACLSRKKKKDYLNSLEDRVKDLMTENKRLLEENTYLKERLSFYDKENTSSYSNISTKGAKPALILCVFLLVVGLNFNFMRSPFPVKTNKADITLKLPDHHGRNLLWTDEESQNRNVKNNTYFSPLTMCPASVNQTESARLLSELEKWIGKPEPIEKAPVLLKRPTQKPKIRRKKVRIDSSLIDIRNRQRYGPEIEFRNEIQVFNPKPDQLYSEFFEAINRKDDTFYVVSFSEQHMLLPALYHNKTARPKMSLLMPSVLLNETSSETYVPLMQIDCEVLDTKLVNVKYGAIPRQYRHYGNVTKTNDTRKNTRRDNTTSPDNKKRYKPYFLSKKFQKLDEYN